MSTSVYQVAALFEEIAKLGYTHKLDDGNECHLMYPLEATVLETGFFARIYAPFQSGAIASRYFVPIERIINDPWFWYYTAIFLRIDTTKSGHFLLWNRFIEKRCMNHTNVEALILTTSTYAPIKPVRRFNPD